MLCNPIVKKCFTCSSIFVGTRLFVTLNHNMLPDLIALYFDSVELNIWTAVFVLKSDYSKNGRSDFLALGFLTVTNGPGDIGLLSVNPSVVETMDTSIMALYCYLSSKFPAGFDKLLMFYRHLCSYIALLLNY